MMRSSFVFLLTIVCVCAGSNNVKSGGGADSSQPVGIGAYAYQDSAGNRQTSSFSRAVVSFDNPDRRTNSGFSNNFGANQGADMNYHNLGQNYAQAGMQYGQGYQNFVPNFFPNMANFHQTPQGGNSAYASGFIGPDGTRQTAYISPANPNNPNVDISSRSGTGGKNDGYYSVSSSSFASSSDIGGKKTESRGAKTIINDNGKIKKYEVRN